MPDWDATNPSWDTVGVDWDEFTTPPPSSTPEIPVGAPRTSYFPLTFSLSHTFRFDVLDSGLGLIGEVHPTRSDRVQITNRPPGAVKRRMSNFHLTQTEAADIDPVSMRIRPMYVPGDGSTPEPLGVFLWADASTLRHARGNDHEGTLHDQGLIWGQPIAEGISFESGSSVYDAMFQVCVWAGFPHAQIENTSASFAAPVAWPGSSQNTYYKVLAELAMKHAQFFDPYFNRGGVPILRAPGDLGAVIPSYVYDDDPVTGRIIRDSVVVSNDLLNAPNRYIVLDTSVKPATVLAEYLVPEDAPNSRARRGWYLTKYVEVQGLASQADAEAVALNMARQDRAYEEISFTSTIDPRHDTYDVMRVLDGDYLETEWTMTLGPGGPMAHKGKRIRHSEVRAPGGVIGTQPGVPTSPPVDPGGPVTPPPAGTETLVASYEAEVATLTTATVTPPSSGSGWWESDAAGRFVSPDGVRTRMLGANGSVDVLGGGPFIFNMPVPAADGGGRETFTNKTNDIKNWGWNIVRCVVLPSGAGGMTTNVNATRDLVVANAAQKIITLVYCLESQAPTASNTPNASTAPFSTVILPFFQQLLAATPASALPYLWLNPNGENREDANFAAWKTLNDGLYSAIRGYTNGANVWLSVSTYNFAQQPLTVAEWNSYKSGKTRVSLGIHTYGAQNAAAAEASRATLRAGNVPFMVEETGYIYDGVSACCGLTGPAGNAIQRALTLQNIDDWFAVKGESVIVWIGTSDTNTTSGFSMRNPPGGYLAYSVPRSEMGEHLWNVRSLSKSY
jgi:hypothetical protein